MIFAPWLMQAATAFNLVCNVTGAMGQVGPDGTMTQKTDMNFTKVLRVDLASNRWCVDDCGERSRIVKVTDSELVLDETHSGNIDSFMRVDRVSGAYSFQLKAGVTMATGTGTCKVMPFTGFRR
jgi:hypothetical protein